MRGGASLLYTRCELLRTLRNRRFFFLSLGFPLALYYLIAAPNRHLQDLSHTGISAPLYFMVGLVSFGTMGAMLSSGARIASERAVGWNRQLRITPLSTQAYFRTKVLTGYVMALISICALYAAGATLGVSIGAGRWLEMTGLILVGLIPFAALGILIGHLLTPDSIGPAMGGGIALLAILGGTWGPIAQHGALHSIAQLVPSYWLVQAGHLATGGSAWPLKGWIVIAAWTILATRFAQRAYRRDTGRV
jgi:ABC-2 type transport system permease protein